MTLFVDFQFTMREAFIYNTIVALDTTLHVKSLVQKSRISSLLGNTLSVTGQFLSSLAWLAHHAVGQGQCSQDMLKVYEVLLMVYVVSLPGSIPLLAPTTGAMVSGKQSQGASFGDKSPVSET